MIGSTARGQHDRECRRTAWGSTVGGQHGGVLPDSPHHTRHSVIGILIACQIISREQTRAIHSDLGLAIWVVLYTVI